MWCVLCCLPDRGEEFLNSCRMHMSEEVLKEAFVFTYDRMKRYYGQWHVETAKLFPDYIFLDTGHKEKFSKSQILENAGILQQVFPEEELLLKRLCGEKHHLGMSRGVIRNGVMEVTEGPLTGLEHRILKIDRHKRLARLSVPVGQREGQLPAGLEIVEKS